MEIRELVSELSSLGFTRPTTKAPELPPKVFPPNDLGDGIARSGSDDDKSPSRVALDLDDFLRPHKYNRDEMWDPSDYFFGDWLEECDAYEILEGNRSFDEFANTALKKPVFDTWAWYCPIHFYEEDFGIYIRGDRLPSLSRAILLSMTLAERKRVLQASRIVQMIFGQQLKQASFLYLFLHEMYHHKSECFATRLEIATGRPVFVPYFDNVYRALTRPLDDRLIEEGLANGDVIRRLGEQPYRSTQFPKLPGVVSMQAIFKRFAVKSALACSLPGYRGVQRYVAGQRFKHDLFSEDQYSLQQSMATAMIDPIGNASRWKYAPNMFAGFWNKDIIAYDVVFPGSRPIIAPRHAPAAVQASPSKVIRAARKWGFRKLREAAGDHTIYIGPKGSKVTIDNGYGDLPRACWDGLIDVINGDFGLNLQNNQKGRRLFLAGPKRLGLNVQ